jgi:predicted RNase H-like nuclease (RuvC/YqgF family)
MDWNPETVGSGIAASVVAWFSLKRFLRTDRREDSANDAIVSFNGAAKSLIDEMRRNIESLGAEIRHLKERVQELVTMNQDCERRNRELNQKLLTLSDRVSIITGAELLDRDKL